MAQAKINLGVLQETKITRGSYAQESGGYSVVMSDAPSQHRGGMAISYRELPHSVV